MREISELGNFPRETRGGRYDCRPLLSGCISLHCCCLQPHDLQWQQVFRTTRLSLFRNTHSTRSTRSTTLASFLFAVPDEPDLRTMEAAPDMQLNAGSESVRAARESAMKKVRRAKTPGKHGCPLCVSTFGRRCELKRHVSEVHTLSGGRRFGCRVAGCGKSFTRKDALAKHGVVKHLGKRRFVCACGEKFTSRYDLSRHGVRVHSDVKKRFTCEFCAAGFSQKSQLTMHKGRVHDPAQGVDPGVAAALDAAIAAEEEGRAAARTLLEAAAVLGAGLDFAAVGEAGAC